MRTKQIRVQETGDPDVMLLEDVELPGPGEGEEGLPAIKQRLRRGRMMLVSALASGHERSVAMAGVPLNCWDARIKVSDYLDGELPARETKVLEEHLRRCPTCPPLYAA